MNESTYRLLPYDGLETVKGPAIQRLVDALDLQPHLGNKMLVRDHLKNKYFLSDITGDKK